MSSEQPLHVVIRIPYKRPPGFVEPPSIIWTEEMEKRLWEILAQKNIDWNSASQLLNVPAPYLLRHAAFLYETQLRDVQMQLRRGEAALSSSNISSSHGNRNRSSSCKPLSALSSVSKEQFTSSRGAYTSSQDMMRTGSNTSLSEGKKLASGSTSSSITVTQSLNEAKQTQVTPSPLQTGSPTFSRRPLSTSSSVSTITTVDPVSRQPAQMTPRQDGFPTTNLSTIESSTTTSFATPAASLTMPLSRTLSNPSSPGTQDLSGSVMIHTADPDIDYTDEFLEENDDNLRQSNEFSLSDKLARLNTQAGPAFLPIGINPPNPRHHDINFKILPELSDSTEIRAPMTYLSSNSQLSNIAEGLQPSKKNEFSAHGSANSSSSLSDLSIGLDSVTLSEMGSAYLEDSKL
ncbi:2474_t:CDS:2 [Dentiscutata erythropus]|uniref:Autophagy-related protein 29 n=1 Tax=Dentiscutata erythropus TaxID=1348616 RepID=A0A9N9HIE5_9GLOM|nr:2474_t:CDS:2 [Dentiscutata erythropus]